MQLAVCMFKNEPDMVSLAVVQFSCCESLGDVTPLFDVGGMHPIPSKAVIRTVNVTPSFL